MPGVRKCLCDTLHVAVTCQGFFLPAASNISSAETKSLLSIRSEGRWFIWHSPGWDISLRVALGVSCAMISFQGEGAVRSMGDFPHQLLPISLESHTHNLLNSTVLRLIISVFFPTCLFPSLLSLACLFFI